MPKLRIGLVGMGFIADWHFRGFAGMDDAMIAGWCQDAHGSAEEQAARQGLFVEQCHARGVTPYGDFDAMAADPALDALIIGSINPLHYQQVLKGLGQGKHLLVEKPVVTDIGQVESIKRLSAEKRLVVFPGHNYAYRGAVRRAREVIDSGALGRRVFASIVSTHTISDAHQNGWRGKLALSSGGALMDSGHHVVYQSLYLLGRPVSLQAYTSRLVLTGMEGEDTAQVSLKYADGAVCTLVQSWASRWGDQVNGIHIVGEKGSLAATDTLYVNGEKVGGDMDYGESFVHQARAFVDCVHHGTPPASTLDDVRDALRIIYGAYQSAEQGTVITL